MPQPGQGRPVTALKRQSGSACSIPPSVTQPKRTAAAALKGAGWTRKADGWHAGKAKDPTTLELTYPTAETNPVLAATGETMRRRDPSTLDELTPQELQIALLLAGGRTTREAATALFLSPKTIEYHLRHVYLKLGINSREALAAALAAQPG